MAQILNFTPWASIITFSVTRYNKEAKLRKEKFVSIVYDNTMYICMYTCIQDTIFQVNGGWLRASYIEGASHGTHHHRAEGGSSITLSTRNIVIN